jgi:hypothetical protein
MNVERKNGVFEIGLALAGHLGRRVRAGVIVFLFQALSEWEKPRPSDRRSGHPQARRRLRVCPGPRRGLTAAVLAASFRTVFDPVTGMADGRPLGQQQLYTAGGED